MTRKESVALMMGSGAINVGTLSSEVSWALFKRHSFENRDPEEYSEFQEVGKQIANKCKGLPLALKTLAGILRSKFEKLHSANQYFLELRSRSLFEKVRESSEWNPEEFLMHDLVNDLAQIASSNLCNRLEENQGSHMLEQTRHLSYSMGDGDFGKLKTLNRLEQLRTLLPIISSCVGAILARGCCMTYSTSKD
uniref:CC-NBS-LRR protein n=1 Tax=Solanum tuberosum TaxID=4113 RepID=M1CM41_SOLTU